MSSLTPTKQTGATKPHSMQEKQGAPASTLATSQRLFGTDAQGNLPEEGSSNKTGPVGLFSGIIPANSKAAINLVNTAGNMITTSNLLLAYSSAASKLMSAIESYVRINPSRQIRLHQRGED